MQLVECCGWLQGVSMQLLECCGWLPGGCYAVARVLWVVARGFLYSC